MRLGSSSGISYELEAATHNIVSSEHPNAGTGAAANSVLQATSATAFAWTATPTFGGLTIATGGQANLAAGSAAAPSFTLGGEQTGMFLAQAGTPRFAVSGSVAWGYGTTAWIALVNNSAIRANDLTTGAAGNNFTIRSGAVSTVADAAGGTLTVAAAQGMGGTVGGGIVFQTPTTQATTVAQTLVTRLTLSQGALTTDAWTAAMAANGRLTFASGGSVTAPVIAIAAGAQAFIGTTDAQNVRFVTNSASRFYIAGNASQLRADTAGTAATPNFVGEPASGIDVVGKTLAVGGGAGTGQGTPGSFIIATPTTLATGTTVQTNVARLTVSGGEVTTDAYTITLADAGNFVLGTTTGHKWGTSTLQKQAWWNSTPVVQQVGGVTITNNVTPGGTNNTIDNVTVSVVDAADLTSTRNAIYQLARKVKLHGDALRTMGLLANADA